MNGRLMGRGELTAGQRNEMLGLMRGHFSGVTDARFREDLAGKDWVVLVEDAAQRIRGFSTLAVHPAVFRGEAIQVVYSGDTIVDRAARNSAVLARTWIGSVMRVTRGADADGRRVFWLLICSGYRTYRFLPVFWREFWPRHDERTPPDAQALIDHLATARFGRCYDWGRGVVRFDRAPALRPDLRRVPAGRRGDPHVAFFLDRNPAWHEGDELVCLCELAPRNLTPAGRRMAEPDSRANRAASGSLA